MFIVYNILKYFERSSNSLINLLAPAKINLSLDVLKKRIDGYHDLKMVMQTVQLHDNISLEIIEEGIMIECNSNAVPSNKDNIAFKAASLMLNEFEIQKGLKIKIQKNIPIAAGLAGGSTDAAAVFKGINEIFNLNLDVQELMRLGKQIGADVPFCIRGGTMLAEGIGEVLTKLKPFENVPIILLKPKIDVSTAWVYSNLILDNLVERPNTEEIVNAINRADIDFVAKNMKNVLETVTIPRYPVVKHAKDSLVQSGAMGSMMSGSGPTVFGIFKNFEIAQSAFNELNDDRWNCFLTRTIM
jgi:4-diphosphocytidyl-2-C-methyl-D-erythritol kinase